MARTELGNLQVLAFSKFFMSISGPLGTKSAGYFVSILYLIKTDRQMDSWTYGRTEGPSNGQTVKHTALHL